MSFEQDIKRLRQSKKMTQQELADILHVSRQTVSTWENGKNYPSLEILRSICVLFDVSFEQIMFGEENTMKNKQDMATTIDREVKLKTRYKKLTITLATIFIFFCAWIGVLIFGYSKGIGAIDRWNPFLTYQVSYTKMPALTKTNSQREWTAWYSDNEMGTSWTKLTLSTGENPGVVEPYVMAYHKGSYVKISRIVPASEVSTLVRGDLEAFEKYQQETSKKGASDDSNFQKDLKKKVHLTDTIRTINNN
ncbi:helix-turn-helix transcriptional regulator [Fructobacillus cardui]|uniref:XRE-family HTH domain (XRE) n=1 Tax=Fructobacillus cardui TaxID=2893170 RepID=A0ABM9N1A8_9LACO|nr:DNA-binding transcriptional regulator [Fructobacillus cardui]CAK1240146.1 DNA-binding transcriptional regulator [Fructobacillus cardui]CAK1253625.1 DNA-binding transcriptional regulator [Fructobacillus cardui]